MRTPRLFNLGCALLAFGVGLPVSAEEPAAVAAPEEAAPAVAAMAAPRWDTPRSSGRCDAGSTRTAIFASVGIDLHGKPGAQ